MTMFSAALVVCALAAPGGQDAPMLLDFTAPWCGPCRQMQPVVDQLSAQGYPIRQVNIDQEKGLAAQFGVTGVPCFVLVSGGRETGRIVGATSPDQLVGLFRAAGVSAGSGAVAMNAGVSQGGPMPGLDSRPLGAVRSNSLPPTSQAPVSPDLVERLLAATVRIKIDDGDGNSIGSGTIIDAREGEALVVTCGHIFRDSQGKGSIRVDLYGSGTPQDVPARMIGYDLESDVGFLSFRPGVAVTAIRVAPPGYAAKPNDAVVNVGCSHGDTATARVSRVTTIDKFLGPPNLQVAGQPVQGRSGGGLFSRDGLLIGVCNAADPQDDEGLYAALPAIHAELNQLSLAKFCLPAESIAAAPPPPSMPSQMPPVGSLDPHLSTVPTTSNAPTSTANGSSMPPPPNFSGVPNFTGAEQALATELGNLAAGAEVVCIIRPLADPRAKSKVVVLDNASPQFLQQLVADRRRQDGRQQTSLELPGPQ